MPIGASSILDAGTLNATLGASALSVKAGTDDLQNMKDALAPYTPEAMIAPKDEGGLGLDMTLEDAQNIKAAVAESDGIKAALDATVALKKAWGLGVA
jgi:hypothetical protein